MAQVSEKQKVLLLIIVILFLAGFGLFWLDSIGFWDLRSAVNNFRSEPVSVMEAEGDEPSLLAREEFEKSQQRLEERVEDLDKREALLEEKSKELREREAKIAEQQKGLELEKKKFEQDKQEYSGYRKNVQVLAQKIANMPPEASVKIMQQWEDPLIIDVLRQMDADAAATGQQSITSYLITLLPEEKASRIMYLMTQL